MNLTRALTAATALAAATLLIAGCTTQAGPSPTPSQSSAAPTETRGPVAPPKSEDEAVDAAESVLTEWLATRGEVNAGGGKDTSVLEELSTGKALDLVISDAAHIANGPILNVDQKNIDGPGKTDGAITYEPLTAYGQAWEGTENGLVTVNACQDMTEYNIWASDGSEAMRPDDRRTKVDYQVVYDTARQAWLVYDVIGLNETC